MSSAPYNALDPTSLLVTHVHRYEGQFGARTFINFRSDPDRTRYLWRASREVLVEPGQTVVVSGAIKGVDESGQIELTHCTLEGEREATAACGSGRKIDPDSPTGRTVLAIDSGGSWLSSTLLIAASLITFIPLVGLLISVVIVPVCIALILVLAVRLLSRRGRNIAGTHIVKRNLVAASVSLLLSLLGGGYQVGIAAYQVLTNV